MGALSHDWTQIRRHLRGCRIVVISNRDDKILKRTLEQCLGVQLQWCVTDSGQGKRRLEALCKAFSMGRYDLVIALTGFVGHHVERACSKSARAGNVTYVRANKGRPTAVYLALKRDLGID